jgi:hypothetical protein
LWAFYCSISFSTVVKLKTRMTLRSLTLCAVLGLCSISAAGQSSKQYLVTPDSAKAATTAADNSSKPAAEPRHTDDSLDVSIPKAAKPQFRVERLPIASGGELLTIFGRLDGMKDSNGGAPEVPLISVVRDTLNDSDPENDRLRYVWMLTYARPNLAKSLASAIPFFYQHVGNQREASSKPPQPIIDLANPKRQTWNRFFWMGMQNVFLDSYGLALKASTRTYRQNASDYRSGHVMQALSILDTFERMRNVNENDTLAMGERVGTSAETNAVTDASANSLSVLTPAFTPSEMLEIRARLILSGKMFGGLASPSIFNDTVIGRVASEVDNSGHNWELLRQRVEAEGLYFEPVAMPDGQPTHALVWVAKSDLLAHADREFNKRFLNITSPWSDERLRDWNGYARTVYVDAENRPVPADEPGARKVEMIPLALYGLNHPKIPALLIDFRHSLNPKKREISRRALNDAARNVLSISSFGNLPYFVGRKVYDFVTGRRGMDVNQPTRLQSYSELKLLLTFNSSIDPKLRNEIERRIQNVSLNPLNNNDEAEVELAQQQYESLIDYAERPDGLAARIERDRGAEMLPFAHGRSARIFFGLANVLSFGRYVHREQSTPELEERLEKSRRLEYHTQLLQEVAKSSATTDVAWDMTRVTRSLQFLAAEGDQAPGGVAKAAAAIFQKTSNADARRLCLEALSKINTKTARAELLKIYEREPQSTLRNEIAGRLRDAVANDARVKPAEARLLLNQLNQQ